MKSLVVGLGEIGGALHKVLEKEYGGKEVFGFDTKGNCVMTKEKIDILHICIPGSKDFIPRVNHYVDTIKPKYTIIHSSVPVGTTEKIKGMSFHSPVRGKHPHMEEGLLKYVKYLSFDGHDYENAQELDRYFSKAGIRCKIMPDTKSTELGKLLALARYGVYLAFAKEQEAICEHFGVDYHKAVTDFESTRNENVGEELQQPLLFPFQNYVGGHCTIEDMEIVLGQYPTPLMQEAYNIGRNTKVWGECNIYKSAKIGKGCNIGCGCEIGENVVIGNSVRIGAGCFIPEGVTIEDGCFIAPGVYFSNDKHPPSSKKEWGKILVRESAVIGMRATILPGVTISERALIGAGSVVTKDVGVDEKWYGNPATQHGEVKNA